MTPIDAYGYFFTAPHAPLERRRFVIDQLKDDAAVIEVAGCGLCHTDLGFISGDVRTKREPPLILGHETSGTVVAAGPAFEHLVGRRVIVPAVLPCGECELCLCGRDNICQRQEMPGNDFDGGFSSHLVAPGRSLCPLPDDLGDFELAQLSVIADAVTTPYQALLRSGLRAGDLAIVIGVGGVGLYMVQHARNAGATVIAVDVDDAKLAAAERQGARFALDSREMDEKALKSAIRALVKDHSLPRHQWRVFETSGSVGGQAAAYALLSFAGTISVVGFTMEKINVRLSNVMAFDAALIGNWGCSPEHYPAVVDDVLTRRINLLDNIELHPLDEINDVIALAQTHKLERRAILVPTRT